MKMKIKIENRRMDINRNCVQTGDA